MTDRNRSNMRTVQLDESFRPGVNSVHINNPGARGNSYGAGSGGNRLSGYQPLMMQNSLANTGSTKI